MGRDPMFVLLVTVGIVLLCFGLACVLREASDPRPEIEREDAPPPGGSGA